MTYLRLIVNALWAGLYGSLLIALLIFFLNDEMASSGLLSVEFARAVVKTTLVYAPAIALLVPTLFVILRFFAARRLEVTWLSLKTIVWTGAAVLGSISFIYYHNLRGAGSLLSPGARDALRILSVTMTLCWLLAVTAAGLAQWRPKGRRGPHRIAAGGFLLAPIVLMALLAPFVPRPARRPGIRLESSRVSEPGGPAILLIGIDSATMDFILPLVSARELPTMERLLKEGAAARLDSIRPCVSRVAWTTLATGMPPWSTGVRDRLSYSLGGESDDIGLLPEGLGMDLLVRAGYIGPRPPPGGGGRRPTLAQVVRSLGIEVESFGWPGDQDPPDTVGVEDERVTYRLERLLGPPPDRPPESYGPLAAVLRAAIATDLSARATVRADVEGAPAERPRVVAVRFPGLGIVCRRFLRYHMAGEFGDVSEEEQALFGQVLSRYYQLSDELIADLMTASAGRFGEPPYVMVVSAYGIEPVQGWWRLAREIFSRGDERAERLSGTWKEGPDGVLLIHGAGISAGARLDEADILDVVPTALYVLGLPVGADLRGQILKRLFTRAHLESHPVQIVPGYTNASRSRP